MADSLRDRIEAGEIPVDGQLPTQAELVEQFDVARATVQRALRELQDEGYVASIQGKGVFARNWRNPTPAHANGAPEQPVSATVKLADAVAEAFEAEHITIDAYCLTSESLNAAIVEPVGRILRGELHPSSITVRLLLPSPDVLLAFPRNVEDPDDARPRERLARLMELQTEVLRNLLFDLSARGFVESVAVEIKTVPITPTTKVYALNGVKGMTGYYKVVAQPVFLDGGPVTIYDVLGVGAKLYVQSAEQFAECREWFNSLWTTIAASH